MPVNFLSENQKAGYGNYHGELTKETLARYFHFDDFDRLNISEKCGIFTDPLVIFFMLDRNESSGYSF